VIPEVAIPAGYPLIRFSSAAPVTRPGFWQVFAAMRALKAGDEEGLIITLMTVKWGKSGAIWG